MRTICLHIDVTDEEKILADIPRAEYERALGYLMAWAKDSYAHVIVYSPRPSEGELVAIYRREEKATPPDYVIGAIWHEDSGAGHYGFHS